MNVTEQEAVCVFKAFTDVNRIRILRTLCAGEQCACKLLENMKITQPTLSHHMKILCDSGIVKYRKEGKWIHYGAMVENMVNHIYNSTEKIIYTFGNGTLGNGDDSTYVPKPPVIKTYNALVLDGMKEITLDDAITDDYKVAARKYDEEDHSEYSSYADTDEDGLYDFLEVKMLSGLISFDEDGNAVLPTFDDCKEFLEEEYFYVENGLQRYCDSLNHDYSTLDFILSVMPVLPINSDPTNEDSDGDTLLDTIDNDPLREIGDVSKCWLYHNDYKKIYLALFGEEEYNNYDDHDVCNHTLMLSVEEDDEGNQVVYFNCIEECCNGSDGSEAIKFLSPSYEDAYMCGDDGFYSDGKYMLIRQLESASLYFMLAGNQKYAEALYHIVDQYRWQNETDWASITGWKYQYSVNGKYVSPMLYTYSEEELDVAVNLSINYENIAVNELEFMLASHAYALFFSITGSTVTTVGGKLISSFGGFAVSSLIAAYDVNSDEEYTLSRNNLISLILDSRGLHSTYKTLNGINKSKALEMSVKDGLLTSEQIDVGAIDIASMAFNLITTVTDFNSFNERWMYDPYYNKFGISITLESISEDTCLISSCYLFADKFQPVIAYGTEKDNKIEYFEGKRLIKEDRVNTYRVSAPDTELYWLDKNYESPIIY